MRYDIGLNRKKGKMMMMMMMMKEDKIAWKQAAEAIAIVVKLDTHT